MKALLTVTALVEVGAAVALMCCPSSAVALLLGSPLDAPAAVTLGRLAGAALLALGAACWLARGEAWSRAARGLVAAMLVYNVAAVVLFMFGSIGWRLGGFALWPAVAIHASMGAWCVGCLRGRVR